MEQVGAFVLEQLLKMQWLSTLFENLLVLFGVEVSTPIGASLHFFLYDTVKIVILLTMMIFAIGYVQTYFPPERSRKIMGRFKGLPGNIVGALLGTVTPFCSCSSIPIFIGFTRAGLPLGVTFSFLISSPMVDVGSLVLVMSIFGPSIAAIYTVVGLVIAVAGGTLIQRLSMEDQIEEFVYGEAEVETGISSLAISERISQAWAETSGTFRKVFPYILVGVGVGALIHNWIPQEAIEFLLGEGNPPCGHHRYAYRRADICGYLRYDSNRRGPVFQGRGARYRVGAHDECDDALVAEHHYAVPRHKAEAHGGIHRRLRVWHGTEWLSVQHVAAAVRVGDRQFSGKEIDYGTA